MSLTNFISRNVFVPLHNRYSGNAPIGRYHRDWNDLYSKEGHDLINLQSKMLGSILESAYRNVPYYHELFDDLKVSGRLSEPGILQEIGYLDKSIIRAQPKALIARHLLEKQLMQTMTGGSTDEPLMFMRDHSCYCKRWGMHGAANERLGWLNGQWYALIWGAAQDLDYNSTMKSRLLNSLVSRRISLDAWSADERDLMSFLNQLLRYNPSIIYGYPVMLEFVAKVIRDGNIEAPKPRLVVVTAETLEPKARAIIEEVFCAPVINRYASREFGIVADEVPGTGFMRVVPGSVIIEIDPINDSDPEFGELIITDLLNEGMPFIRYRTGDVGRLSWRTVAGFEGWHLSDIAGRTTDMLVTQEGKIAAGVGADIWFEDYNGFDQIQIHQLTRDKFFVKIVPNSDYSEQSEIQIREGLRKYCGSTIEVNIEIVSHIPVESSGKHRLVVSEVASQLFKSA